MSRVFLALALLATRASADPARTSTADSTARPAGLAARVAVVEPANETLAADARPTVATAAAPGELHHAIYADVLGKAGLWGLGYDWQFLHHFAIGAAGSYYSFDGDRVTTLAPYVAAYPLEHGHHRGFVQLGASAIRRTTPSPVPEWDGVTTTKLDAELCAGYEYRNRVLIRAYAMASQGDHLVPWLGGSFGWTL